MSRRRKKARRASQDLDARLAAMLGLLASPARRAILLELARGPKDRRALAARVGLSASAAGRQLDRLRAWSLVAVKQVGRRHVNRLGPRATAIIGRRTAILALSTPDGGRAVLTITLPKCDS